MCYASITMTTAQSSGSKVFIHIN